LNNPDEREATKRADIASHFILRAAYCRTEDLRRWFLTQECALFKYELSELKKQGLLVDSLRRFQITLDQVSRLEKEQLREKLLAIPTESNKVMSMDTFAKENFFKVPFTEALDLIMNRQCYVAGGCAFVPADRLIVILVARFRVMLSKSLAQAAMAFSHITGVEESSRIAPLLYTMNSQYTGRSYDASHASGPSSFDGSNVHDYVQNMPLCMSQLHKGLQSDHKLKHWGRLQYGLFLKGAGLTMEDSMLFFQKEFTKMISPEKFQKEYAYNIRHMYGKEGKRADYTPYNCTKIVLGNPPQGSGDHHGCPFKHYDDEHLSALLNKLHIGQGDVEAILSHKRMKNYSLACIKHFEATHPNYSSVKDIPLGGVGDHPNAWFAASVAYRDAKTVKDAGNGDNKKITSNNNIAEESAINSLEGVDPMDIVF